MNNHTCVCSYNSFVQDLEFDCLMMGKRTPLQASQGQLQIRFGLPVGTSLPLEREFNFNRLKESSTLPRYFHFHSLRTLKSIRSGTHFAPGQGDAGGGPF
jgi:hypothetical protein